MDLILCKIQSKFKNKDKKKSSTSGIISAKRILHHPSPSHKEPALNQFDHMQPLSSNQPVE